MSNFVTLCTIALQAPLSMGSSKEEYWSGLPCPPPGDLPNLGIKPMSLLSPALAGDFFTTSATWEAQYKHFFVHHIGFSTLTIMLSINKDSFTFSFQSSFLFLFLTLFFWPGAPMNYWTVVRVDVFVSFLILEENIHSVTVKYDVQFSRSVVSDSATPWIAARQASLSITNSQSLPKLKSIKSVMPSSHLILCHPLLLLPPIPPSIRVFSNESTLRMRWPKYWVSASASVLPMNTQDWSPLGWTAWTSLQSKGISRVFSNTTVQKHHFFGTQLSLQSNSHIHTWPQEKP